MFHNFSIKYKCHFDFAFTNVSILAHSHERKEDWTGQPRWVPTTLQPCCIANDIKLPSNRGNGSNRGVLDPTVTRTMLAGFTSTNTFPRKLYCYYYTTTQLQQRENLYRAPWYLLWHCGDHRGNGQHVHEDVFDTDTLKQCKFMCDNMSPTTHPLTCCALSELIYNAVTHSPALSPPPRIIHSLTHPGVYHGREIVQV